MSAAEFEGFSHEAFAWFEGLEADNSKAYFTGHRPAYEATVRGPVTAMLHELADELGGEVKMFRQHRDIRFSADKSPYKTRTYGVIGARPEGAAPLFAQVSAAGLFAGTGYYEMDSEQLTRFRDAVVDEDTGPQLTRAVERVHEAGVETFGEALKTAPRGYPREHPRITLLRHRFLIGGRTTGPAATGLSRDAALDHARFVWITLQPVTEWLDANVGSGSGARSRR
jgi:uncharacterized protein (TIGR02453 family)